jgi:sec-independent protein translocase protein TatC
MAFPDEPNSPSTPGGEPDHSEPLPESKFPDSADAPYRAPHADEYDVDPVADPKPGSTLDQPGWAGQNTETSSSSASTASAPKSEDEEDPEEDGMLRMSFMEHLEELRNRLIQCVIGLAAAFGISLTFAGNLWTFISEPAISVLQDLGIKPAQLVVLEPTDLLQIIWWKMPFITSIFIASPWILWHIWGFISPGLYKKERRYAGPFVGASAMLFLTGGLFAYFIAFRYGLKFLLGFNQFVGITSVQQQLTATSYFDLFVNVILGVSLVFELPMIIFLLILLRVTSSGFLLRNSRYAILLIVIIAAVITPTPDVFNLALFSIPMILLYFVGIFAGYLVERERTEKKFPWMLLVGTLLTLLIAGMGAVILMTAKFGYKFVGYWPFLTK